MNKKIITFAIAALGLCGLSASAQAPSHDRSSNQPGTEQQVDNKMYKPQKFTDFAFEGILLDVNQQAAIDKINQQYAQQFAPQGNRHQQKCDSTKCDKQKCDKQKPNPDQQKGSVDQQRGNRKAWMRDYAAQVKEVLTPDQYVMFLENVAFNVPERPAMANGPHDRKMDKAAPSRHHADARHRHGDRQKPQRELKAQGSAQQSM